jgi:hypothetical protein
VSNAAYAVLEPFVLVQDRRGIHTTFDFAQVYITLFGQVSLSGKNLSFM